MSELHQTALVWLRRDLRLEDHAALYHALKSSRAALPVFIFDRAILDGLPRDDRRVDFIWQSVAALKAELQALGGDLLVRHGLPAEEIPRLAVELGAQAVFCNHDYEPAARARDAEVERRLARQGVAMFSFKDQVVFERDEVLTGAGKPFGVFTPYKNAWLKKLTPFYLQAYPVRRYLRSLMPRTAEPMPPLTDIGFRASDLDSLPVQPGSAGAEALFADFAGRIDHYQAARDFPAVKGVSYLSAHLRFGTISIRQLAAYAWHEGSAGAMCWLGELIWRDFYQQVLWHRPEVAEHAFKPEYDALPFPNNPEWFAAWREGRTGYPLVDAAMRQLNRSGYMHNRLRMVAASFLVKDLLIDWRWGEKYFAEKLLDFDLAANNGGWQWAASTGCDAQPYFRIFNPVSQSEKFDAAGRFIRRYVPELSRLPDKLIHAPWQAKAEQLAAAGIQLGRDYPHPIVDHAVQRLLALALFKR
ncbi:cryptochrome/photolyase family protein [Chromobacterium sphagni]|uniref:Deoxyribodipyrimidine photo-lyase n=1 Tax=Chromobacterium sphagni TaxID=1903179 RepID=A0A1S1X0V3_9NEIS|nr:deoxyribodipyrimidine photo-lyase [Chromobacterium sphagni]OHX13151.1 deoxyribodipyrimidine photolyase [Chromobacterium sphagni]OHX21053.1 deoxyribodipyrimidine photolyase [Chromobacterium sphagni]